MKQDKRESLLNRVAIGMAPSFEALDALLPARIRVAIGFTSRSAKGKAISEYWDNRCAALPCRGSWADASRSVR